MRRSELIPYLFCGALRFSEEIPNEENEINNDSLTKNTPEAKPDGSPPVLQKKVVPNITIPSPSNHDTPIAVSDTCYILYFYTHIYTGQITCNTFSQISPSYTGKHLWCDSNHCPADLSFPQFDLPAEEYADYLPDGELLAVPLVVEEKNSDNSGPGGPIPSTSLDFNDNEDIPTELSDSSETHDEGTEQSRESLLYSSHHSKYGDVYVNTNKT